MNRLPRFDEFQAKALARGYDEVLERRWELGTVLAGHKCI